MTTSPKKRLEPTVTGGFGLCFSFSFLGYFQVNHVNLRGARIHPHWKNWHPGMSKLASQIVSELNGLVEIIVTVQRSWKIGNGGVLCIYNYFFALSLPGCF